jgi:hypothetical protein
VCTGGDVQAGKREMGGTTENPHGVTRPPGAAGHQGIFNDQGPTGPPERIGNDKGPIGQVATGPQGMSRRAKGATGPHKVMATTRVRLALNSRWPTTRKRQAPEGRVGMKDR